MKRTITLIILLIPFYSFGQEESRSANKFEFSFSSGVSTFSLKDQSISSQKYSGTLRPIALTWKQERSNYTWNLSLKYESGTIRNFNVNARLEDLKLEWNYHYPVKKFKILNRPSILFAGFSPNIWAYNRKQEIAEPGYFLYSTKFLFNMGLNTGIKGSITKKLWYEVIAHINLLTYGLSSEAVEGSGQIVSDLSTMLSNPIFEWDISSNYQLLNWLNLGLSYQFKYYNHEKLVLSADSFKATLSTTF